MKYFVARMERSVIRGFMHAVSDSAALHPGYVSSGENRFGHR